MAEITPVTEWPDWHDNLDGGDPLTQNFTAAYDKGDLCWMLVCTILCWQITPAIGFLYAGMHRRKAADHGAVVAVLLVRLRQPVLGVRLLAVRGPHHQPHPRRPVAGRLKNVLTQPSQANADIPDILYAAFGFIFVSAMAMILAGAMLERGRLWAIYVSNILAYWEWNPSGWLYKLGVYDFVGSGPVHIASDTATDRRLRLAHYKPHSPLLLCIGTCFIWFGWIVLNGGSSANLTIRSFYVVVNTNLAACGGGIGWILLDYAYKRKFSLVDFCSGIIAGLVGITPAAGYVPVFVAARVGLITATRCYFTVRYKYLLSVDDGLDNFAIHGVGGLVGDILTGLFAAQFVPAPDGVSGASYAGGCWNHHWKQLDLQLAGATTCATWSVFVSCLLNFVINKIPGLHLRASEENEVCSFDAKYLDDIDYEESYFGNDYMISESGPTPRTRTAPASEEETKKE
ncbi:ammonium transporter AmtB-like domain-containing protein [Lasiosphaeria ovina]|uniref:Ammonium transporter AmtB-like domain-containing protein n=1 Tax=Lasiosphaeria ovina TaxID=92902 RepID=A0AAE0KG40_9PEZI|nr:ammonium transporter AmtB-like domain-containing protein [Lasiosphaeria ovina]